jgi:lipopolysaccharide/colanic/teichoic acid biosynthesis glycosyltransferase
LNGVHRWVGRAGDLVVAGTLLFVTLPLMLVVAVAIKCDSGGPVLIREERVDRQGHRFLAIRFRITAHRERSAALGDPEITFVGGFIAFLRIDSLPQLINVLRGEMTCSAGDQCALFFLE